ncbi:MAG: M48 family metalloprotease [Chthonomonas sp.]|nr:M48 family metalloprotease [Chthonomonas sp.]
MSLQQKPTLGRRVGQFFGNALSCAFQVAFLLVIGFFTLASCSSDVKGLLGWTGLWGKPEKPVEFRQATDSTADMRILLPLGRVATMAGMDLDKIKVAMARDQRVNALTMGSDTFVFFEGLTKLTDAQIEAVVAHEVAHAILDHSRKGGGMVKGIETVTSIAGALLGHDDGASQEAKSWAVAMVFSPYSRNQELEADRKAVELLRMAGYPARATDVMCETLGALEKEGGAGGGFLSTHPAISERVAALRKEPPGPMGILTKQQYWDLIKCLFSRGDSPFAALEGDLGGLLKEKGEEAARSELKEWAGTSTDFLASLIQDLSAMSEPKDYSKPHGLLIKLFEDLQGGVEKKLEAARAGDLQKAITIEKSISETLENAPEELPKFFEEGAKLGFTME